MFSKKYTEDLLKERVDGLSQLDKIEFNQRVINENIFLSKINTFRCSLFVAYTVLICFFINFANKYLVSLSLGLLKISRIYFPFIVANILMIAAIFIALILNECRTKKREEEFFEENEEFLEERLKKK